MPTYTYRCTKCNNSIEVIQKITDNELVDCDKCKQPTLKKVILTTNKPIFSGKGWFTSGGY